MKASEVMAGWSASPHEREADIFRAFVDGTFIRWPSLEVSSGRVSFFVAANYFAVGDPFEMVFMPMNPITAQRIADLGGWSLPTKKMVDLIWGTSTLRAEPQPWGPPYDASMVSTQRIVAHSERIVAKLAGTSAEWQSQLVAGTKKDVVLSNRLDAHHVAIYGWHHLSGQPIQGLNPTSHDCLYADYSHGIRFVERGAFVDGEPRDLLDILADPALAPLLSDEGVMHVLRQPGVDPPA